ncbi:MAG TPA: hypothetical protein VFL57_10785, partial [Bryobacteraceae bacterium]|nr:hypothetical protein [Bryobacteraceae bacterium]
MQSKRTLLNFALVLLGSIAAANAQANAHADRVRDLNREVALLHAEKDSRGPGLRATARSESTRLIAERAAALDALIRENPAEAIPLALPPETLSKLAAEYPEAASLLETNGTWQGAVERWTVDDENLASSKSIARLALGDEHVELYFGDGEPAFSVCGSAVEVTGMRVKTVMAVTNTTIQTAPPACSTAGAQNTAVLLVTFPNVVPAVTSAEVRDVFFGAQGPSLDGFWREASYGKTWPTGGVYGPYTLSGSYTCADLERLRADAITAAALDLDFTTVNRLFIVLPDIGCGWAGLSTSPCALLASPDGQFNATTAYLRADLMTPRTKGVQLVTHEVGHNFSLFHAGTRDFGTEALGPLGAAGTISEFGDWFSTLGAWSLGQYSAPHKAQLGWIRDGVEFQTVEAGGGFTLTPWESGPGGLKALRIRRGVGNDAWLWLEYRQPIGDYDSTFPSMLSNNQVFAGALVHYQDAQTSLYTTNLLDFTPETDAWTDPALVAGQTWTDAASGVAISVSNASPQALTVTVSYGAAP